MKELQNKLEEYQPERYRGIATAVFREAMNAGEFLERINEECDVEVSIATQALEGYVGFLTAVSNAPTISEKNIISWDNGGGSFQVATKMSNGKIMTYEGPIGNTVAVQTLIEEVRGKNYVAGIDPYPITCEETRQLKKLLMDKIPAPDHWLSKNLSKCAHRVS